MNANRVGAWGRLAWRACVFAFAVAWATWACRGVDEPPPVDASSPSPERSVLPAAEVPFEWRDGAILVPVRVRGAGPFLFALQTGARASLLGKGRAQAEGLLAARRPFRARTRHGWDQRWRLAGTTLEVGGLGFTPPSLAAGALSGVPAGTEGVLGIDFLERYVVELDYPHRRLRIHEPASFRPPRGSVAIPLQRRDGRLLAQATIPRPGRSPAAGFCFLMTELDAPLILGLRFAESQGLMEEIGNPVALGRDATGRPLTQVGRLPQIQVGTVNRGPVEVFVTANSRNAVGNGLLQQWTPTFDLRRHCLWALTNAPPRAERWASPGPSVPWLARQRGEFQLRFSGAVVAVGPDAPYRVVEVVPGSAAYLAGLRRDDVLRGLDGRPPESLSLREWMRLIGSSPRVGRVEFQRGNQVLGVSVVLNWTDSLAE